MTADADKTPPKETEIIPDDADDGGDVVEVTTKRVDEGGKGHFEIPARLPILPIRDTVVFPGTVMPLQIVREKSKHVLDLALSSSRLIAAVTQRSSETEDPRLDDLYRIGTACAILKMLKMSDGSETIVVHGLQRIGIEDVTKEKDYLEARVHTNTDSSEVTAEQEAFARSLRTTADRIIELSPDIPDEARQVLHGIDTPGGLADFLAANLTLAPVDKQELLETLDVTDRLRKVSQAVAAQLEIAELSNKIQGAVRGQVSDAQREYYLREQMKAIQKELGDTDAHTETLEDLRQRVQAAKMPESVDAEANRELDRLEHIPQASPEYSTALDYVEWLAELPWSVSTDDNLDISRAEKILDEDHYGLDKIKKRILEFLAVRTLKKDSPGPILCFTGPPGVGKTSLGQSIARALGRNFIRISLGGVRDEAAIRGHRRTYVGSMPGRIIREIRRAGSNNPLFMLDEIDKLGQDFRGDPMSALLEVLDPAQNSTFSDHYLGVPFDLSGVMFIATANYTAAIGTALLDRMEVIELSGYTRREKLNIAKRYLLPRQLRENGLTAEQVAIDDQTMAVIVSEYTREAGVRSLERKIGAVCRARAALVVRGEATPPAVGRLRRERCPSAKPSALEAPPKGRAVLPPAVTIEELREVLGHKQFESEVAAKRPPPGVVTGLAFTPTGGEILFVEAAKMPGTGQLNLTGQLGEVMRESAYAATSILRSRTGTWNVKPGSYRSFDFHIHVPAGAVPKDGPSAGVAMLTALTSILTERAVDPTIGMTGEITLSGRVLPIGGLREKVLAAHRAGLKSVILPARNKPDLEDIPEDIREQIEFKFVETIDEVLDNVFGKDGHEDGAISPRKRRSARKKSGTTIKSTRSPRKKRSKKSGPPVGARKKKRATRKR